MDLQHVTDTVYSCTAGVILHCFVNSISALLWFISSWLVNYSRGIVHWVIWKSQFLAKYIVDPCFVK